MKPSTINHQSSTDLYPGQSEELRRRADTLAQIDRAHAAILPGALREAFAGDPSSIALANENGKPATFNLQPVTLGLTVNLQRINSPLLEVVRVMREVFSENNDSAEISTDERFKKINQKVLALKFEEEQIAETIFIFVRPQKKVRQILEKGRDHFREVVMDELGDKLHPAQMAALQRACSRHYIASFATIIGYGVPPPDAEGEVSFPAPSPNAPTASAGG